MTTNKTGKKFIDNTLGVEQWTQNRFQQVITIYNTLSFNLANLIQLTKEN